MCEHVCRHEGCVQACAGTSRRGELLHGDAVSLGGWHGLP